MFNSNALKKLGATTVNLQCESTEGCSKNDATLENGLPDLNVS